MIDFEKSSKLYYSIKEVASHFGVNESLLRFWEKEFHEINPRKTEGGARQYTKEDVEVIGVIRFLVKEKGLTLEGTRQRLKVRKSDEARRVDLINRLESVKRELNDLKNSFEDLE